MGNTWTGWGAAERPQTSAPAVMTGVAPVMRTVDGAAAAAVAATKVRSRRAQFLGVPWRFGHVCCKGTAQFEPNAS